MSTMPAFARRPKFSVMNMASLCTCVSAKPRLPKRPATAGVKALRGRERQGVRGASALVDDDAEDVGPPRGLAGRRRGEQQQQVHRHHG